MNSNVIAVDATYLRVGKRRTKDIRQEQDHLVLGIIHGWGSDIGFNTAQGLPFPCVVANSNSRTSRLDKTLPSGVPS